MNLIGLDLDGTLEDSRADMIAAVRRVREGFGLPARTEETIRPWINQGMDTLYRNSFDDYLKNGKPEKRMEEVRSAYETDYMAHVACETRLYPGIAEALPGLATLGAIVVVTNKPERISQRLLEALDVGQHVTDVIGGDSCEAIKPSSLMLRAAEQRTAFDPSAGHAFMIGDTAGDIKMGQAYGATTIWCTWGYADEPGAEPDLTARRPEDLPALVQSVLSRAPAGIPPIIR